MLTTGIHPEHIRMTPPIYTDDCKCISLCNLRILNYKLHACLFVYTTQHSPILFADSFLWHNVDYLVVKIVHVDSNIID